MLRRSWIRSQLGGRPPFDQNFARAGEQQAVYHFERGGFAGAAAAQQHQRLASFNAEAQLIENELPARAEGDLPELDRCHQRAVQRLSAKGHSRSTHCASHPEAGPFRQPEHFFREELVGRLGPDGFAGPELNGQAAAGDRHGLVHARSQMHLDAALALVPAGLVLKVAQLEIAIQFAIDARRAGSD